jgi:hypothetical protein
MAARLLKIKHSSGQSEQCMSETETIPDGKASMSTETEHYFRDFQQEAAAFDRQLPQLLERFLGQYVAVFQGEVIDHSPNWDELSQKIHQSVPNRFVLLERVVPRAEKQVVHMDGVGS